MRITFYEFRLSGPEGPPPTHSLDWCEHNTFFQQGFLFRWIPLSRYRTFTSFKMKPKRQSERRRTAKHGVLNHVDEHALKTQKSNAFFLSHLIYNRSFTKPCSPKFGNIVLCPTCVCSATHEHHIAIVITNEFKTIKKNHSRQRRHRAKSPAVHCNRPKKRSTSDVHKRTLKSWPMNGLSEKKKKVG